ncbi:tRNA (adenosine(37)-N6)-threonylcarbamoyltransferase complex ATPase subunit type 1 TsaE [Pseudogracilibacillus auburnensis]|uniref:tRNA threonylcarbamoyladenosine biosynthesis protein TsaE n=1 Tax=Pseudogracilibacillus auburnensis TaxID=1494959 RepID=A0A2V3W457_9BACI|nr:tRNA (adenosine(37)-N6)-threonylcarbamoyltransferase complex ATPase subunit type 1 TsaE [Pseudogracilibacillus auburnensis]MBO1002745.1 tRNA (adenosine(37)-N6)-threonylcarbamoyltransferase complex ATPase subunit type 1 TsaE [Pseudogracilibacillus auburnensis]PXW87858.1 tRNA threonylcarbamoyladenosine biosynthesis protein TsaE [Pseudogracilibacillus auburnensis]
MNTYEIVTHSEKETMTIAETIANLLQRGDVLTLDGNLGTGKTTFTKGLAKGLQIKRAVTSPTFTIVKEYTGTLPLYHMDAYRLENSDEDIGFDEYFYGNGICVVEWAQFIEEYLPENRLQITLTFLNQDDRKITFQATTEHFSNVINKLKNAKLK